MWTRPDISISSIASSENAKFVGEKKPTSENPTKICCLHYIYCWRDSAGADTYRSVLGRLGAWLPDCSGCTSPGRSRPVQDTGQILACLHTGRETNKTGHKSVWGKRETYLRSSVAKVNSTRREKERWFCHGWISDDAVRHNKHSESLNKTKCLCKTWH